MILYNERDDRLLNTYSKVPRGHAYSEKDVFESLVATKDVSVIVPCYNSEMFLDKCLKSILEQETEYNFEVIAVNDGSQDKTQEILESFRENYENLRVVTQENRGFSGARNRGIKLSKGKYLMFLDSDDYVSAGYIQSLISNIIKYDSEIAACGFFTFYKDRIYKTVLPQGNMDKKILNGCFWGKAFKRELFKNIMLPEGFWYEDSILKHLIYPMVKRFCTVSECQYAYRSNPNGITMKSKGRPKSLDTFYITNLMIQDAEKLFGIEKLKTQQYYDLILEQFYLNQRRLLHLPIVYQKAVFLSQADFIKTYFEGFSTKHFIYKGYQKSLKKENYNRGILEAKLDKIYKIKMIINGLIRQKGTK